MAAFGQLPQLLPSSPAAWSATRAGILGERPTGKSKNHWHSTSSIGFSLSFVIRRKSTRRYPELNDILFEVITVFHRPLVKYPGASCRTRTTPAVGKVRIRTSACDFARVAVLVAGPGAKPRDPRSHTEVWRVTVEVGKRWYRVPKTWNLRLFPFQTKSNKRSS